MVRKSWVLLVLLVLLVGQGVAAAPPPGLIAALDLIPKILTKFYDSIPTVNSTGCTGFYLSPAVWSGDRGELVRGAWLVTAGHCGVSFNLRKTSTGVTEKPYLLVASAIFIDAALFIGQDFRTEKWQSVFPPILDRPLVIGEHLVAMGYGRGGWKQSRKHQVLRTSLCVYRGEDPEVPGQGELRCGSDGPAAYFTGVRQGMSGSPVVTAEGKLAGILVRGDREGIVMYFTDIHRAIDLFSLAYLGFPDPR